MDAARLEGIPLFASLPEVERARLARWMEERDADEGEVLAAEGLVPYEFFVIDEGTATVTVEGKELAELGPGDFFGEVALLDSRLRTATVTAATPMKLIVMYGPPFRSLEREMPEFPKQIRAAIAERLAAG